MSGVAPRPPAGEHGHAVRIGSILLASCLAGGGEIVAGEVSGYVELAASSTDRESEDSAGLFGKQEADGFIQSYNLVLSQDLYPNLRVLAGGLFRNTDATLTTVSPVRTEVDSRLTSWRPFTQLILDSDPYRGQLSYTLFDERQKIDGVSTPRNVRETLSTFLGWRPDRYPSAQLRWSRTDTHDGGRMFVNLLEDRFELTSLYDAIDSLRIRYRGNRSETDDRINANRTVNESHNARIVYADSFWSDKLSLSSDYNGTVRETETTTNGSGEVTLTLSPFSGLSAIDDTPEAGALPSNPSLIDGNLTAGSGINLGLPPPGGNDEPRNLGLDFGVETELNTLFVWVDRELPANVADSFSWDIYTSTDNGNWTLRQSVAPGIFGGPFLPRFELRFPNLTARYIKVVADPLAPAVQMASDFPLILVTELQASVSIAADQIERERSQTTQIYNLNSRLRVLDAPFLYYEFDTLLTDTTSAGTTYLVTNGLSLNHAFNEVYSVNTRVTRENGHELSGDREAWVYTAALTSQAIEKWRNRAVFSGRNEEIDGQTAYRNSILFYTILELYRGLDINLGVGKTFAKSTLDTRSDQTLINTILKLTPHRELNINLIYRENSDDSSFAQGTELQRSDTLSEVSVGYTPLQSLYFFGSYRETRRPGEDERTIRNLTFNWTPFPQGTLRFNLNYNESFRSSDGSTTKNLIPGIRWSIRRSSFLDVTYQKLKTESIIGRTDTAGVFATLRWSF